MAIYCVNIIIEWTLLVKLWNLEKATNPLEKLGKVNVKGWLWVAYWSLSEKLATQKRRGREY
jgi:hypothetical protein